MDATSIITQVSPDDEQLNVCPDKVNNMADDCHSSKRSGVSSPQTLKKVREFSPEREISVITDLSPLSRNISIKVRVFSKANIRTWTNAQGEGKVFNFHVFDAAHSSINVTLFDALIEKFYEVIQVDHIYYLSSFIVRKINQNFATVKNDYEIHFNNFTIVEDCTSSSVDFPTMSYTFVPLQEIQELSINTIIDIIGICYESQELVEFVARTTNRQCEKRNIMLIDSSSTLIELTLWGDDARHFDGTLNPIVVIKNAKINEWHGVKTVSLSSFGNIKLNSNIKEADELREWYMKSKNVEQLSNNTSKNDLVNDDSNISVIGDTANTNALDENTNINTNEYGLVNDDSNTSVIGDTANTNAFDENTHENTNKHD